jgi:hypothetical protein
MRLIVTGVNPDKKIQAIKGIRAATGLGLKEAKHVADDVVAGTEVTIDVFDGGRDALDIGGVTYRVSDVPLSAFITLLSQYPAGIRVGDLVRVLSVVEKERS